MPTRHDITPTKPAANPPGVAFAHADIGTASDPSVGIFSAGQHS